MQQRCSPGLMCALCIHKAQYDRQQSIGVLLAFMFAHLCTQANIAVRVFVYTIVDVYTRTKSLSLYRGQQQDARACYEKRKFPAREIQIYTPPPTTSDTQPHKKRIRGVNGERKCIMCMNIQNTKT